MKTQLSKLEQNASDFVSMKIRLEQPIDFTLVWKKNDYGFCPSVYDHRENKIAYAGGCGYDKGSAAVAQVVRWMFPSDSPEHMSLWQMSGVGVDAIETKLRELGWNIEKVGSSPVSDSYRVTKAL